MKCKWKEGRTKVPMSQVFDTDEAVEPVLEFLADSDVGRVTGVREGVRKKRQRRVEAVVKNKEGMG